MAKKSQKQKLRVLYNGTPFTKDRFEELKRTMSKDEDLKIIWTLFENVYGSFMKESFKELITTQKFLVDFMAMLRESAFLSESDDDFESSSIGENDIDNEDEFQEESSKPRSRRKEKSKESDFIDTLSKCIKSLQTVNEVIHSMRNTMISPEDVEEVKTVSSESISIIDQLANEHRKH